MLQLYDCLHSGNCYKVRLLLTQLGTPFRRINVDVIQGEARAPAFLRINPNGKVPVLQVNADFILPESNAILCYLARDTPFFPIDPNAQAQVLRWLFFETHNLPNIGSLRYWLTLVKQPDKIKDQLATKADLGKAALKVMETHLQTNTYFVANQYSIADIALYAYTHVAPAGGFDLSAYPNIITWINRVAAQPNHIAITHANFDA